MKTRQLFLLIDDYIKQCDKVLESQDVREAIILKEKIVALDPEDLPGVANGIDEFALEGSPMEKTDPIKDIGVMKERLIRYKDKI